MHRRRRRRPARFRIARLEVEQPEHLAGAESSLMPAAPRRTRCRPSSIFECTQAVSSSGDAVGSAQSQPGVEAPTDTRLGLCRAASRDEVARQLEVEDEAERPLKPPGTRSAMRAPGGSRAACPSRGRGLVARRRRHVVEDGERQRHGLVRGSLAGRGAVGSPSSSSAAVACRGARCSRPLVCARRMAARQRLARVVIPVHLQARDRAVEAMRRFRARRPWPDARRAAPASRRPPGRSTSARSGSRAPDTRERRARSSRRTRAIERASRRRRAPPRASVTSGAGSIVTVDARCRRTQRSRSARRSRSALRPVLPVAERAEAVAPRSRGETKIESGSVSASTRCRAAGP